MRHNCERIECKADEACAGCGRVGHCQHSHTVPKYVLSKAGEFIYNNKALHDKWIKCLGVGFNIIPLCPNCHYDYEHKRLPEKYFANIRARVEETFKELDKDIKRFPALSIIIPELKKYWGHDYGK